MTAIEVLQCVEAKGARLVAVDGKIMARPAGRLEQGLCEQIRAHKSELLELLLRQESSLTCNPPDSGFLSTIEDSRATAPQVQAPQSSKPEVDTLGHLRRFCPQLWNRVRTTDGREGILWRVGPVDVAVSFDPSGPIYTLNASEVEVVGT